MSQRPTPLVFWYRRSGEPLMGIAFHSDLLTPGIVDSDDPPPVMSGMMRAELDQAGRLTYFEAIPPQRQDPPVRPAPVDWAPLFDLAGLDRAELQPASRCGTGWPDPIPAPHGRASGRRAACPFEWKPRRSAGALYFGTAAFVVLRWGLLSFVVGVFVSSLLFDIPATLDTSAWYFGNMMLLVAMVAGLAAWAFTTATAGRPWRTNPSG